MASESADLAQLLRTTLHLVERRPDLDHKAPSVNEMKESIRRTIAELEKRKSPAIAAEPPTPTIWSRALRRKKNSGTSR